MMQNSFENQNNVNKCRKQPFNGGVQIVGHCGQAQLLTLTSGIQNVCNNLSWYLGTFFLKAAINPLITVGFNAVSIVHEMPPPKSYLVSVECTRYVVLSMWLSR
ncbi:hypothetical protein TNCT_110661 [Trichonephila clavata]|uniref:Uncharacterized protein n=1 Tax=Trichonephila clavata TaxID=2740835 RepID=A0A8X6I2A4_TRICU|nr:hypothetical protein TNCT_110661 [Trichonephila clavata]